MSKVKKLPESGCFVDSTGRARARARARETGKEERRKEEKDTEKNPSVCTFKTSPCAPARMLNSTHGGVLDVHGVFFPRAKPRHTPHRHTRATNAHCTPAPTPTQDDTAHHTTTQTPRHFYSTRENSPSPDKVCSKARVGGVLVWLIPLIASNVHYVFPARPHPRCGLQWCNCGCHGKDHVHQLGQHDKEHGDKKGRMLPPQTTEGRRKDVKGSHDSPCST